MSEIEEDIRQAVRDGKLQEPFRSKDVKEAYPGWGDNTFPTFLPKHRGGNSGGCREIFIRVEKGLYKLKKK